ncbi:MAG TPA: hypothetical protein PK082_02530 [Phycisphaerae bacterium]|nr:hypothetical protein [Phycisphaerae bacterium]
MTPRETKRVNVFLAGIIQGSKVEPAIHAQDWRGPIREALARHAPRADVYCHYSEHPESITYELPRIREVFAEGNRRAAACDVLVAYVPSASMGTAVEMHEAARNGAVVLAITPLKANWVIRAYSDRIFETVEQFEAFLAADELDTLLRAKGRGERPKGKGRSGQD